MIIENTNTHVRYVQNTHTAHIIDSLEASREFGRLRVPPSIVDERKV